MTVRMTALVLAACGAAILTAPQARAQRASPMLASRFVQICNTPRGNGQQICDAYITGMADSFALVQAMAAKSTDGQIKFNPMICIPRTTTGEAMRGMVISWIAGHRERLRDQVGEVVFLALHDSYPCDAMNMKPGGPG